MRFNIFVTFLSWAPILFFLPQARPWSSPTKLAGSLSSTSAKGLVTYTDRDTGYTHFVWCNDTDGMIWHTKFVNIQTKETISYIKDTKWCQNGIDFIRSNDDSKIYVAYTAFRNKKNVKATCDQNSMEGCQSVYYTTSTDSGFTWSTPRQISNSNDPVNRLGPKIFVSPDSSRMWIVYKSEIEVDKTTTNRDIKCVVRPKGSSIFGNEKIISFTNTKMEYGGYADETYVYTWTKRDWPAATMSMVSSPNNGITWTKEKHWQGYCEDIQDMRLRPFVGSKIGQIISQCIDHNDRKFYVKVSDNGGVNWKPIVHYTGRNLIDNYATNICFKVGANSKVIYTFKDTQSQVGILSIPDGAAEKLEAPLDLNGTNHLLECHNGVTLTVRLIVQKKAKENLFDVIVYEDKRQ